MNPSPNDFCAVSTDGRVQIVASSVYMLAQTLSRAREGDYRIARVLGFQNRINGETTFAQWGLAEVTTFADGRVVKIREYGPTFAIKRWVIVHVPPRPSMERAEC